MKEILNEQFEKERALYNIQDTLVKNCIFAGKEDGESVLKETRNIVVSDCQFSLRYPLWHAHTFKLLNSSLDEGTRAPIWYSNNGEISNTKVTGIKCLRECRNINLEKCDIDSEEFGWKCNHISIHSSIINSVYCLFDSNNVRLYDVKFSGKYSFQYINNLYIKNSTLDTKDAFWHSSNVVVEDCVVKGEYLGWFSKNLTFINCKIIGTQPLCYCENLKLINCTMEDTDLSFEYSSVEADIDGNILSIKNPRSGYIKCDSVGEIIHEQDIEKGNCEIIIRRGKR